MVASCGLWDLSLIDKADTNQGRLAQIANLAVCARLLPVSGKTVSSLWIQLHGGPLDLESPRLFLDLGQSLVVFIDQLLVAGRHFTIVRVKELVVLQRALQIPCEVKFHLVEFVDRQP